MSQAVAWLTKEGTFVYGCIQITGYRYPGGKARYCMRAREDDPWYCSRHRIKKG